MRRFTIILLVAAAVYVVATSIALTQLPAPIPKQIWTYWNDPAKLPRTVQLCMDSWRKHNPDYRITLLTKENYAQHTTIPAQLAHNPIFHDNPTRFSDLVRIWTLAQHGGIWIDSSVLVKQPVSNWLPPPGGSLACEFIGYYIAGMTTTAPVIENWFYAAAPNSPFMRAWRDAFSTLADHPSVSDYVASRQALGVDISKIIAPEYLAQHVAAQKVLQIDRYPRDRMYLRRAEDGPFRYLVDNDWDSAKALQAACANSAYQTPMMKLRGVERGVLESELDGELSVARCGW